MSRTARAIMVVLIGIIIASLIIAPAALGSTLKVTGTPRRPGGRPRRPAPTRRRRSVTLIDATNTSDAGNIIGQQRIDGIGDGPITFAVPYDSAAVDAKHAYAIFATVVDGTEYLAEPQGRAGHHRRARPRPCASRSRPSTTGSTVITGRMPLPTGRHPERQCGLDRGPHQAGDRHARQPPGPADAERQPAVLLRVLRPDAHRSGRDLRHRRRGRRRRDGLGERGRRARSSSAARPPGRSMCRSSRRPRRSRSSRRSRPRRRSRRPRRRRPPRPRPRRPTSTAPTDAPSATPEPTARRHPRRRRRPSPTPTPTASPTPAPTASPTPPPRRPPRPPARARRPTPSPVPSASLAPPSGVLTGTLDYPESYQLSADAVAVVALVEGKGKVTSEPDRRDRDHRPGRPGADRLRAHL